MLVIVALLGFAVVTEAQQPAKVPRIGYLAGVSPSVNSDRIEAFRQGLRDLGYVEGKNIVIEWRSWEGKQDRLPSLAAELVHLKVVRVHHQSESSQADRSDDSAERARESG